MGTPLQVGDRAPEFSLQDQFGQDVSLAELRDHKNVLVVFYPFAFSGICRGELTEISGDLDRFQNEHVQIVAISCDPMFSLRAWADDQGFTFPLLTDFWPHGEVASRFGVFDERAGMAIRGTFLIDTDGVIRWTLVNKAGEQRDFAGFHAALAELD